MSLYYSKNKLLAIDLYAGLGGWSDGLLAEGWDVVGFDIERHQYGEQKYPAQLVIQDVLTIHGSQFRNASLIVASPPCQAYSYMAMPWKLAKAKAAAIRADGTGKMPADLTALFDACFRIQREACAAAGRYIPMVVENVKGAQPWVGRAKANFGSFYLWGDVAMVGTRVVCGREFGNYTKPMRAAKDNTHGATDADGSWFAVPAARNGDAALKVPGFNFHEHEKTGLPGRSFQSAAVKMESAGNGINYGGDFGWGGSAMRTGNSKSPARKAASAQIAKIPLELSSYIARHYGSRLDRLLCQ